MTADSVVHYTYRTAQGVLITSLSDGVNYSDCATGCKIQVLDPSRYMRFFSSLKCPDRLRPPSLLFKGYGDSSLGIKWPGHGVDHSLAFRGQE